jgi:hypothetical protein
MLTLFVVVYGISQRPTLQTAVGDRPDVSHFLKFRPKNDLNLKCLSVFDMRIRVYHCICPTYMGNLLVWLKSVQNLAFIHIEYPYINLVP